MAHKLLPLCLGQIAEFHPLISPAICAGTEIFRSEAFFWCQLLVSWFSHHQVPVSHHVSQRQPSSYCCLCSNAFPQLRIAKSPHNKVPVVDTQSPRNGAMDEVILFILCEVADDHWATGMLKGWDVLIPVTSFFGVFSKKMCHESQDVISRSEVHLGDVLM